MASRSRFIPWYNITKATLVDLITDLNDIDVMGYVSDDKLLTIPLSEGNREKRPLPVLEVEENGGALSIALVYREVNNLKHLRNILHNNQTEEQSSFNAEMRLLPSYFETRLWKKGFKEINFVLQKKYVASRVDSVMLSRLIEEAEIIRSGGRRINNGQSVYEAPATPVLQMIFASFKPEVDDFKKILNEMKPVIKLLLSVKTQKEMIHSKMMKPVDDANKYRGFIELLNRARSEYIISAEERRGLDKKWRETPEERGAIEEDLRRRLDNSI